MKSLRLDLDQTQPIYKQIMDGFKRQIARGDLMPGDRIPSQRDLALALKVNPNTTQRAYREMEAAGLVETLRGQGTFIRHDIGVIQHIRDEMAHEALDVFVKEMMGLGLTVDDAVRLVRQSFQAHGAKSRPSVEGATDDTRLPSDDEGERS